MEKFRGEYGSYANFATATVDSDTLEKDQEKLFANMLKDMEG